MDYIFGVDWRSLFTPDTPLFEIFIRGTLVYLALFLMLRFVLKREVGSMGIADLLLIVLLADASQGAISGGYDSIVEGMVLIATLAFWNYLLDVLAYHSRFWRRIIRPPKLTLLKDGEIVHENLEASKITEEELRSAARSQGIADFKRVRDIYLEPDGMVSVLTYPTDSKRAAASESADPL